MIIWNRLLTLQYTHHDCFHNIPHHSLSLTLSLSWYSTIIYVRSLRLFVRTCVICVICAMWPWCAATMRRAADRITPINNNPLRSVSAPYIRIDYTGLNRIKDGWSYAPPFRSRAPCRRSRRWSERTRFWSASRRDKYPRRRWLALARTRFIITHTHTHIHIGISIAFLFRRHLSLFDPISNACGGMSAGNYGGDGLGERIRWPWPNAGAPPSLHPETPDGR